ncbi:hypothetical protein LR48_Vigan847s001300 [Vigna angularis]|uniref:Uncharacterized protein n=2 Tax=Phaseolus angularis TaxID=3914 RepID=A0A0L9THN6_PHAAN|nr:uncharacterized protein LOC108323154 [Vigna angularis]KAG2411055.1 uncharacterized protein HKW66_Vig0017200 [Vigna angularis]KOM30060.1 hypothetical protein LR48_Vigan847s001300 [Vigna angularis]BAT72772.1 hypothetical protein VIGAN_01020900 [Vigna angularis var. angularis]
MCSEIVPPRFSFSHDVSEQPKKQDASRKDTMLLGSNHDFEFSTGRRSLEFESSSADELFSNGVMLPVQMQQKRNTTRKHTLYGEAPYTRLPPLPCSPIMKKDSIREVVNENGGCCEKKTQSNSFWGFGRSKSLSCDGKKSFMSYSPPLSRSNSTGSVPLPKRVSSSRQHSAAKPLSSSTSSTLNLYPVQRSRSGKSYYGGSYANGLWISPVLNLPTPCISKASASLFGLGSFLRVGRAKKSKK